MLLCWFSVPSDLLSSMFTSQTETMWHNQSAQSRYRSRLINQQPCKIIQIRHKQLLSEHSLGVFFHNVQRDDFCCVNDIRERREQRDWTSLVEPVEPVCLHIQMGLSQDVNILYKWMSIFLYVCLTTQNGITFSFHEMCSCLYICSLFSVFFF